MTDQPSTQLYAFVGIVTALAVVALGCLTVGLAPDTVTTRLSGGEFGIDNDSQLSFDVSDSNATVDAAFVVVNFQSDSVAGDGSATDNLIAAGDLSQSRDLSSVDTLNIPAGDLTIEGA